MQHPDKAPTRDPGPDDGSEEWTKAYNRWLTAGMPGRMSDPEQSELSDALMAVGEASPPRSKGQFVADRNRRIREAIAYLRDGGMTRARAIELVAPEFELAPETIRRKILK